MTNDEILDKYWEFADVDVYSIRAYLERLLYTLWLEGEGFSGKRPFGNSGWEYDLYTPLVAWDVVEGKYDGEYLEDVDTNEARIKVFELIEHCFKGKMQ